MLKRRWQFWVAAVGLLKLGCVLIPATAQLQKKDIVYRVQASSARAILCVEEPEVREHVLASAPECDTLTALFTLGDEPGFLDFDAEMAAASEQWDKPAELPKNDDIMLIYFTSGTTGMPKMAAHSWTYPIAQTVTAYYWHNVGMSPSIWPWPTPAGPRRAGASSTASGSAAQRCLYTILTASSPPICSKCWKSTA